MEIKGFEASAEKVLASNPELRKYFTPEDLEALEQTMIQTVKRISGKHEVKWIEFTDDEKMAFAFKEKRIFLGLGNLKRMMEVWLNALGKAGEMKKTAETSLPNKRPGKKKFVALPADLNLGGEYFISEDEGEEKEVIKENYASLVDSAKEAVLSTLKSDAAHEAGHAVIDRDPTQVGIPLELINQLGMQFIFNSGADCRNDQRVMDQNPDLVKYMEAGMEYAFAEGGRLNPVWRHDELDENGYPNLMSQLGTEIIALWYQGRLTPSVDPRVAEAVLSERDSIDFIAKSELAVPSADPSEAEVIAKAAKTYGEIAQMNIRTFQKLIPIDIANQTVHQAISIVALHENGYPLDAKVKDVISKALETIPVELGKELNEKLGEQKEELRKDQETADSIEKIVAQVFAGATEVFAEKKTAEGGKPPILGYRDLFGPAIRVEELTDELREWLIKLFQALPKQAPIQVIKKRNGEDSTEDLAGDPVQVLKDLEDQLAGELRPSTIPQTFPNHAEIDAILSGKGEKPSLDSEHMVGSGSGGDYLFNDGPGEKPMDTREFPEIEDWLDANIDMPDRIRAWRKAIHSVTRGGSKFQFDPTNAVSPEQVIDDEIRTGFGMAQERKIFEAPIEVREKMALSVLWRTQGVSTTEALKLILFLKRIYEDPEVRKFLDLEILISQDVGALETDDSGAAHIVLGFGQDPIRDHETMVANINALTKGAGGFGINQDASAVKAQRVRLQTQTTARPEKRFAIDCWDDAAVQKTSGEYEGMSQMGAVGYEVKKTKEELKGRTFCFTLGGHAGTNAQTFYGPNNSLRPKTALELIQYLDIVVQTMIKYRDGFAAHIKTEVRDQLGIAL